MSSISHELLNKKHEQSFKHLERVAQIEEQQGLDLKRSQKREKQKRMTRLFRAGAVIGALGIALIAFIVVSPAKEFPVDERVIVAQGASPSVLAGQWREQGVIRSELGFKVLMKLFEQKGDLVKAGTYLFEEPLGMYDFARRLINGNYGESFISVTIPEGVTLPVIAELFEGAFNEGVTDQDELFPTDEFLEKALAYNGLLFPETYFFTPGTPVDEIIETMHSEFSDTLADIAPNKIGELSAQELRDIVIMASIIEREAAGEEDAYLISGILWKRLDAGMLLQVDATLHYRTGKASSELTLTDLASEDEYNTYVHAGLPPGPIGNPGRISLDAALHPAQSPYFYYLHGRDGKARYAKNFAGHRQNKRRYID